MLLNGYEIDSNHIKYINILSNHCLKITHEIQHISNAQLNMNPNLSMNATEFVSCGCPNTVNYF